MKPFERIEFHTTPYNSIRVWMHYNEDEDITSKNVRGTKEFDLFQAISIWGSYDKVEFGLYSWELSNSLVAYIKEKFGHRSDSIIEFQ
ncbi:hypothetical protein [Paenibacillus xylanexedens]|uniref:hypothetical protein n=1 Tax=Paenibacillus xylanexedens TaxID=528191 RepID=UPI0011A31A35|nr:hypothetical protein [Paenibacillus xylanexedens]